MFDSEVWLVSQSSEAVEELITITTSTAAEFLNPEELTEPLSKKQKLVFSLRDSKSSGKALTSCTR